MTQTQCTTRFKFTREWYIPKNSTVLTTGPDETIIYGYDLPSGKVAAVAFGGKRNKPDWHYSFRSLAQREAHIKSFMDAREHAAAFKEQRKNDRAEAQRQFKNPFVVGDVLHHSWGWEQTNCDYYEVVEVKEKSVVLRPIAAITIPGSQGFMSESLKPVKGNFLEKTYQTLTKHDRDITPENPTITKQVKAQMVNGTLQYYIPVPYGWCDKWNGEANYHSWYA